MSSALVKTEGQRNRSKSKGIQNMLKNVTKEMYRRNYELAQTNKTLSLLRNIDSIALASHETVNIFCDNLSETIVKTAEFPFAAILTCPISRHALVTFKGFAFAGDMNDGIKSKLMTIHVNDEAIWYTSEHKMAILKSEELLTHGLTLQPRTHQQVVDTNKLLNDEIGLKSIVLTKLSSSQKNVGVMVIGFKQEAHTVSRNDLDLIQRLADSIGVAVESKLLFEENKLIAEKLQKANDKLKALDEAKDDFISMASHQLRTPLTSVKGYISMVLEGDVGKITNTQKEMLNQAFFSSQRMVYLIADLLNVSRLKTGKFIIEPGLINLADVVGQELSQVYETAAAKNQKLIYDKPKDFPTLTLDETKTRQVIMNFVDNAIYYTQAGGQISVKLIDNPQTIELRVEDNGIGVPKAEQHHLFTKFYRAGNARKARPDGTGLGLFMAKKVIAAEGGSIIFESEEGKGSTFGFVFSKAKLAPKTNQPAPNTKPTEEMATV